MYDMLPVLVLDFWTTSFIITQQTKSPASSLVQLYLRLWSDVYCISCHQLIYLGNFVLLYQFHIRPPYPGCRDSTAPFSTALHRIPHPLYFARQSRVWHHGGVCFIDHEKKVSEEQEHTLSRIYDISLDQFNDIVGRVNWVVIIYMQMCINWNGCNMLIILHSNNNFLLRINLHDWENLATFSCCLFVCLIDWLGEAGK